MEGPADGSGLTGRLPICRTEQHRRNQSISCVRAGRRGRRPRARGPAPYAPTYSQSRAKADAEFPRTPYLGNFDLRAISTIRRQHSQVGTDLRRRSHLATSYVVEVTKHRQTFAVADKRPEFPALDRRQCRGDCDWMPADRVGARYTSTRVDAQVELLPHTQMPVAQISGMRGLFCNNPAHQIVRG